MLTADDQKRLFEIADRIELQGAREGDLGMSAADAANFLRDLVERYTVDRVMEGSA